LKHELGDDQLGRDKCRLESDDRHRRGIHRLQFYKQWFDHGTSLGRKGCYSLIQGSIDVWIDANLIEQIVEHIALGAGLEDCRAA